jgi:hypothetical protein
MTDHKEICRSTLRQGSFLIVNKKLIHLLGVSEALLLSDLIGKEAYFEERGNLTQDEDGTQWFFNTRQNRLEDTGLSFDIQYRTTKRLQEEGLLKVERRGMPAKHHFSLDHEAITNLLQAPIPQSTENPNSRVSKNPTHNNNKGNSNKNRTTKTRSTVSSGPKDGPVPESTERTRKPSIKRSPYLSHWNMLPNLTHHIKTDTKTYPAAVLACRQLTRGTFFKGVKYDPEHKRRHNISDHWFTKKWTREEILRGMDLLSQLYSPGYWGYGKMKGSRSLMSLFYSRNSKSMLLAVMADPSLTVPLADKQQVKDPTPYLTELFTPLWSNGNGGLPPRELRALVRGVKSIGEYQSRMVPPPFDEGAFYHFYGTPDKLCRQLRDHIRGMGKVPRPDQVKASGWLWDEFVKGQEENRRIRFRLRDK